MVQGDDMSAGLSSPAAGIDHNFGPWGGKMNKRIFLGLVSIAIAATFLFGGLALAGGRTIPALVSTQWLAANLKAPNLVIVDVRSAAEYKAGHVPGSVSAPFKLPVSAWIVLRNKLLLEVPDAASLFKTIGGLGIKPGSRVVLICSPAPKPFPPYYGLANATRVAVTLIYAGVRNVALLDGGFPKWQAEKRPVSLKAVQAKPVAFKGKVNKRIFVSLKYVRRHLKKASLIDARNAIVYYGVIVEPWTNKAGHIPGASSLPGPWIWQRNKAGYFTYRDKKTLAAMAAGVFRKKSAIVYCGVGGYASSWWYVLTQVLGRKHVMFFDGSAQEWGRHYNMVPFRWE
jgi:thiosulfate/3-mercaptopyruvate sulfurtransferase